MKKSTFVNLNLGETCNSRCKFCYNDKLREWDYSYTPIKDLLSQLDNLIKYTDSINLIWWEPLYYPSLFDVLDYCTKVWFKKITIVTNWTRLSDIDFCKRLISYDIIKRITLSIHSINSDIEENITQRKWFLEKKLKWLDNLLLFSWDINKNFTIAISLVINSYNYCVLSDTIDYFQNLWIKNISLSWMILTTWTSNTNMDILPKYIDVIWSINKVNLLWDVRLIFNWMPLCIYNKIKIESKFLIRELMKEHIHSIRTDWNNLFDAHISYKTKCLACNDCYVYWTFCNWPYTYYIEKYWIEEFHWLEKKDFIKMLLNHSE